MTRILFGAISLVILASPAAASCIVERDPLPASGGSGPAVESYTNVDTGARTTTPGPCLVVDAENGARQDADEAGDR